MVELPDGVQNIMEIQVFPNKDPIQSMILDHARVGPCSRGRRVGLGQMGQCQSWGLGGKS